MKTHHLLVFVVLIAVLGYMALNNQGDIAGMIGYPASGPFSMLGGPVYSSKKANISMMRFGAQPNSYGGTPSSWLR